MEWEDDHTLLFLGYEGISSTLGRMHADGTRTLLWKEEAGFSHRWWPRFSRAGSLVAAVGEDFQHLPEVWLADVSAGTASWHALTDVLATWAADLQLGDARRVEWKAPDGLTIQGILVLPPGQEGSPRREWSGRSGPLPLVVVVHGGPTSLYTARTNWLWAPFLAARGLAVLLPNPRGSTGRGLTFAEANLADMGGGDLQDILAGVDYLVATGIADPDRLGIGGWSYGGYMTAWAITQTTRFKAAVVGAGITNWLSFHGTAEIPTWDAIYLRDEPYGRQDGAPGSGGAAVGRPGEPTSAARRGEAYARWSPMTYIERVTTPTLLLHGEKDGVVPAGQALEFYRALRELGVETELRIYAREPHGPREWAHMRDYMAAAVDWWASRLLS